MTTFSYIQIGFVVLSALTMGSCTDKYTTKPQIKFKSASASTLRYNDMLNLKFEVTDKEGDLVSPMVVFSKIVNKNQPNAFPSEYTFDVPSDFPTIKNLSSDVTFLFVYGLPDGVTTTGQSLDNPRTLQNDTLIFGAYVKDADDNFSDTAYSGKIVLISQN